MDRFDLLSDMMEADPERVDTPKEAVDRIRYDTVKHSRTKQPVAGVHVSAVKKEIADNLNGNPRDKDVAQSATTDEDGNYELELEPGEYVLYYSADGFNGKKETITVA